MDQGELERLASGGLADFPPAGLTDVAAYCWDRGVATGDARHCVLWRTFDLIASQANEDEHLPPLDGRAVEELDDLFRRHLLGVLRASTAEEGAGLAQILDEEVRAVLQGFHYLDV